MQHISSIRLTIAKLLDENLNDFTDEGCTELKGYMEALEQQQNVLLSKQAQVIEDLRSINTTLESAEALKEINKVRDRLQNKRERGIPLRMENEDMKQSLLVQARKNAINAYLTLAEQAGNVNAIREAEQLLQEGLETSTAQ